MAVWTDHVVYAVGDLDEAAERWREELGLASVPGGRHPGWGTANRLIPLGRDYVELIAVGDAAEAAGSWFGRAVGELGAAGGGWFTWCLGDDDIDGTASRLDLEMTSRSRERPDGSVIRWRSCGLDRAVAERGMPFFIEWDVPPELHPGRTEVEHPAGATGIAGVEVAVDPRALWGWLGDEHAGAIYTVVPGAGGIAAVQLALADGGVLTIG
jgi:hypothetical protein